MLSMTPPASTNEVSVAFTTPETEAPAAITAPAPVPVRPDPTRYGDWEKGGRCIDF